MNDRLASVLEKITKLRTLAERATTQGEAEAAAAQAEALIAKYQIDETQIETADPTRTETVTEDEPLWGGSTQTWISCLANGLSKDHGCGVVADRGVGKRITIRIAGRPSDVALVRYMFAWLTVEIERLAAREDGRAAKNAFRVGATMGVLRAMRAARVVETRAAVQGDGAAIVLVDRAAESIGFLKQVIGGSFKKGSKASVRDAGAFHRGEAAGAGLAPRQGLPAGGGRLMLGR